MDNITAMTIIDIYEEFKAKEKVCTMTEELKKDRELCKKTFEAINIPNTPMNWYIWKLAWRTCSVLIKKENKHD